MSALYCPKCQQKSLKRGKCLQCGFIGEGKDSLSKSERLMMGKRKKPPEPDTPDGIDLILPIIDE